MGTTPTAWLPPEVGRGDGAAADGTWRSPGYRSSRMRGMAAIALLAAAAGSNALGVAVEIQGLGLVDAAEAGTLKSAAANAFDSLRAGVGLVQVALYLASAVAVLAWLSRIVENVPPLTGRTPRRSPREAIGWWFVPFANFVVPYRIVSDAVRRLRTGGGDSTESLLLPWWTLWLAGSLVGNLVVRLPTDTLGDVRTVFILNALSAGATAVAGALLVLIVRGVERRSGVRARALGIGHDPRPAWPQAPPATPAGPTPPAPDDSGWPT
ncbi:MAG: DUF4328 domain-containing protein [Chloroflexota bacterium]